MLEVIFDGQALGGVVAGSGIGRYTRNLLAALAERDDVTPLALCEPGVTVPAGVQTITVKRLNRRPRAQLIEHCARLPLELHRHRPPGSVFHNPGFHAPAGVAHPWVQTLLDVIPLVFDTPDQAVLRARWKRFGPRYKKAAAVVAISRHAADEGIRLLGLDPARVHVAHLGVDPVFTPRWQNPGQPPQGRPYLLVVAEYSQRKGFPQAFAVSDNLVDAGYPHRLVVAGRVHPWGREELRRLHARARHPERIEILGYAEDLPTLYHQAACFIMTSRYEGFGLPCLEAMACGTPVVSFDNTALTEIVTGGGQLVADGDVTAMTAAVRTILDNPTAATETSQAGIQHASRYTWANTATIHAHAYHTAAVDGSSQERREQLSNRSDRAMKAG